MITVYPKDTSFFSLNSEVLVADKVLTKTDATYQYLDPGSLDRIISLPSDASKGRVFVIKHNGEYNSGNYLSIKDNGTEIERIYSGVIKTFILDGINWVSGENCTGDDDYRSSNVAVGAYSDGSLTGVAVGGSSKGASSGTAIGYAADGSNSGVALGRNAKGYDYGVALGRNASSNGKNYAIAKGYYSRAERWNEEVKSADGSIATKYSYSTLAWIKETLDDTQREIFLGNTADKRCTVYPRSGFGFSLYITAVNYVDGKGKRWKMEGLIKRDGSNNTALIGTVTKTIIAQSDTTGGTQNWDVIVTADDTNEALKIEVKGEASKTIRWIVRGEIEEVRF